MLMVGDGEEDQNGGMLWLRRCGFGVQDLCMYIIFILHSKDPQYIIKVYLLDIGYL